MLVLVLETELVPETVQSQGTALSSHLTHQNEVQTQKMVHAQLTMVRSVDLKVFDLKKILNLSRLKDNWR